MTPISSSSTPATSAKRRRKRCFPTLATSPPSTRSARRLQEKRARHGGHMLVAVAGCVAQAEGEEIIARAPVVDIVVGPQAYHRLPEMVARATLGPVVDTSFPAEPKFDHLPQRRAAGV